MPRDQYPFDRVQIIASPDVHAWPATTAITKLGFRRDGVAVEFTKKDGPDRWPDVVPPGWDGPIQFTLWIVELIGEQAWGAGIIEFWHGLEASGGDVTQNRQIAENWCYDTRWGPLNGRQPAPGEFVGFLVTAGDARGRDVHRVAERSNLVVVRFPASAGAVFTFNDDAQPAPAPPQPPIPTLPPAAALDNLDRVRDGLLAIRDLCDSYVAAIEDAVRVLARGR